MMDKSVYQADACGGIHKKWHKYALMPFGIILFFSVLGLRNARPAALPTGFADELLVSIGSPTALAFTPDQRLLITTQGGKLRVYKNNALLSTPALDLSGIICSNSERGLLGVAVDPDFVANNYIYLFYTFKKFGACTRNSSTSPVNRVSRFVLPDNNIISAATEDVLLDNIPSPNGNHNGGDLHFGQDGQLYVGDGGGGADAARDEHTLLGKILRITPDGNIPAGNPFQGVGTARCNNGSTTPGNKCQETFAWGLRNPFRFAFKPESI